MFRLNPERAHHLTFSLLKLAFALPFLGWFLRKCYRISDQRLEKEVFGLKFKNPVGLAAGLDKDAVVFNELASLGFGFVEIGTLTPKGQPGNDKPRLFRLRSDKALINRMGFNNKGVEEAVKKLKKRSTDIIIGGNIGKNKITPNEEANSDYEYCFNALFDYVDYFVVNVSSPNTPNLRALQEKEPLKNLLNSLQKINKTKQHPRPLLLKIAPDLTDSQLDDIIEIVRETGIDGVVATNTTIDRSKLSADKKALETIGAGGLSGKPLFNRSVEVVRYLKYKSGNAFPVIGVGGIFSSDDAMKMLDAGADLIQIYTGFIYEGPDLVKEINDKLSRLQS